MRTAEEIKRVRTSLTREQAIRDYLRLKKEFGRPPIYREYTRRFHGRSALGRIFGPREWSKLVIAAGEKPIYARDITRGLLVRMYRDLREKLGRQPTSVEYITSCYGPSVIRAKFGVNGWKRLLAASGDKPLTQRNISKQHLIDDFLDLQKKLGRRPKLPEYTYQCHTPKVLDRAFGKPGWKSLITALGGKAMPGRFLTADHLIGDYLEICVALGREPSKSQFHQRHRHASKTLVRLFGTPCWRNFKKAARKTQSARGSTQILRPHRGSFL